ncbi:MAG: hypothetical protein ACFFER_18840, partial [Candidatus Thorarchaeota archaeon]
SNVSSGNWLNITWSFKIDWDHADLTDVDAKLFVNDTQDSDIDWYEVDWDTETKLDYSVTPYLSDDRGNIDTNDLQGDGTVIYYGSSDNYPYANETDVWVNHDVTGSWSDDVDGSGAFTITGIGSSSSVRLNTYSFKVVEEGAGSGGSDLYYTTSEEDTFITDRIQVQTTVATDARVDVDANSEIRVTLWLDYDNSFLGSGDSVILDNTAMTWDSGNSWFNLSRTKANVGLWKYFVNSSSDATYGITAIDLNSQEIDIIWDRIQILTTTVSDSRLDVNADAELRVTAQLEYDGHLLGSGDTLYLDDVQMTWNSGDSRFELLRTQASVGLWNYYVNLSNAYEATYGITLVDVNGQSQDVVWDRIRVLTTTTEDGRIDYGTAANIQVTAELEYDGHVLGSADTLYMNGTPMSWVSTYFQLQPQFSQVGLWTFFVNSSGANEATYGISLVNLDGKSVDQIWDRILVLTTTVDDSRIDVNTNAELRVTAELEYDGHPLGSGDSLYMDDVQMTWDGPNIWFELTRLQSSVGLWKYNINSSNALEATYEITIVNLDGKSQDVIWDRIRILTATTQDDRIDYGSSADIRVTAELEFDHHLLGAGDTLYMNDTVMNWVSSYFQLQPTFSQVGLWTFFVNTSSANEATYGISVVNLDGKSVDQIWDLLRVILYEVTDTRCNIDSLQTIKAIVIYDYDNALLTASKGTVYLNNSAMTWNSLEVRWSQDRSSSSVGRFSFIVTSITDTVHGLSVFSTTAPPTIIWDALTVTVAISDSRINIGESAIIQATAVYDYNGDPYDGSLNLNNTQFTYFSPQIQGYTVSSALGDDTYGIIEISEKNEIFCIWDSLSIYMTDPTDQRIDINANASGIVVGAEYDYDGTGYDGTLTLNNTQFSYMTAQKQGYTVSWANGDDTYGITVISINDETYCIWDSLTISITDPADQRININDNASGIVVTAFYDYDLSPYDGTINLNDTVFTYGTVGRRGYTVASTVGDDT